MKMYPNIMLERVLQNDPDFVMGHVLVGASEFLTPRVHADQISAKKRSEAATTILERSKMIAIWRHRYKKLFLSLNI